jgi:hypothetical protein
MIEIIILSGDGAPKNEIIILFLNHLQIIHFAQLTQASGG